MQSASKMLSGPEKLAAVTKLVDTLRQDLTDGSLSPQPPEARQKYVDLGYEAKACSKLKNDDRDDEFLVSRVIFLTTYGTNTNIPDLIDKHHLAETIVENLERHANRGATSKKTNGPMEQMALAETLKLLFNITHYCKDKASSFSPAVPHIVTLLRDSTPQPTKPLDPPIGSLINALLNLNLGTTEIASSFYPDNEPTSFSDRLLDLLTRSSKAYNDEDLETNVTPLVGVIRAVHEYAPEQVKASIRKQLLPTETDRNEVLGKSTSIPSWLLKNSTNPLTPHLRETISDLLFEMSDKDATTFVSNVGYGFASGFLFNRNLPVPDTEAGSSSDTGGGASRPINPVTGQFLDRERQPDLPEMTEEEQEQEAERLFVLFERLRANGVISVENPVRTAVEQGRFEELPDDYQENVD
ncbi:hypothetical protein SLS62_008708 [Diatrype stigma]|uniref:Guanine nucleotide exchange factor synembryn n=1 Tax=Diatrype stigma TaxID=117547 RepID=A0AAN9YN10_9PEZI